MTTRTATYKGTTYHITKTDKGYMNSVQTATGMVENGYYVNEFACEADAHDTINLSQGRVHN